MEGSYIYDSASTQSLSVQFKRTQVKPVDISSIFSSYADAVEYAKGKYKAEGDLRPKAHDERGIAATSYAGQIITVYENDTVKLYKIMPPLVEGGYKYLIEIGGDVDCGEF